VKKHLVTFALAVLVGVFGFAVSGIAVASNGQPPSPPGQGDCEHGNSVQNCKDDPSENGKDCEAHGNNGGVNEDHCKGDETTPTETTPTTPTETTPTTPTETTPTGTTPTESNSSTPSGTQETTPAESAPAETTPSDTPSKPSPSIVGTPPTAQRAPQAKSAVRGVNSTAPKPTTKAQKAPFTL
jgi:hypothetical protein